MTPRSWLFVPGDRPDMVAKALDSGADAVIVDLEDSVLPQNKPQARKFAPSFAKNTLSARAQFWVRINALQTTDALLDLAAVVPAVPVGIVLPKAESTSGVIELGHYLSAMEAITGLPIGKIQILAIATETPKSVFELGSYATSGPRLMGLTWGAEDLSVAIGATGARDGGGALTPLYELVRSLCIAGAAAAGVAAIETIYPAHRDIEGMRAYAQTARRDGFQGMLAVHPAQVPVINEAFTPTSAEFAYAERIIAAFEANPGRGAVSLDGKMLDAPHLSQARRLLAAHERLKT